MRNIFKIFFADVKRISTNVVAVVVILGLCILPSLYAWFNILSNWDPYGPSATRNLKIAVASDDEGVTILGNKLLCGAHHPGEFYGRYDQFPRRRGGSSGYYLLRECQEKRHCLQDHTEGQDGCAGAGEQHGGEHACRDHDEGDERPLGCGCGRFRSGGECSGKTQ